MGIQMNMLINIFFLLFISYLVGGMLNSWWDKEVSPLDLMG